MRSGFISTFFVSLLLTPLVRRLAMHWRVFDHPNDERRVHQMPMPRLGGAALYFALLLVGAVLTFFHSTESAWKALWLPTTFVFLLGVVDDVAGVRERWKLALPALSAALLYALGWRITRLSLGPDLIFDLPEWLGLVLTVVWIVGITNACNLIDGVDGLAVSISIIAVGALIVFGQPQSAFVAALLLGALLGFLPYNFHPAKIFLGDSGSLLIGFLTAALVLTGTGTHEGEVTIAAPVVLGLPIVEAAVTLLRRWRAGQPLLPGDRGHFHHKLLDRGWTQRQIVGCLSAVGLVFALCGLLLRSIGTLGAAIVLALLGIGIFWGVRWLGYVELQRTPSLTAPTE